MIWTGPDVEMRYAKTTRSYTQSPGPGVISPSHTTQSPCTQGCISYVSRAPPLNLFVCSVAMS